MLHVQEKCGSQRSVAEHDMALIAASLTSLVFASIYVGDNEKIDPGRRKEERGSKIQSLGLSHGRFLHLPVGIVTL